MAYSGVLHGVPDTPGAPRAVFVEKTFNFGNVKQGVEVTHKFQVKNEGTAPLLLDGWISIFLGSLRNSNPRFHRAEGFIQVDWNRTSFSPDRSGSKAIVQRSGPT